MNTLQTTGLPRLSVPQITAMGRALIEELPHGSGINGTWHIQSASRKGKRLFMASNTYSAMDAGGGYCHDYPFEATFVMGPEPDHSPNWVRLEFDSLSITDERKAAPDGDMGCGIGEDFDSPTGDPPYYDCGDGLDDYLSETLSDPVAIALSDLVEVEHLQTRAAVELVLRISGSSSGKARDIAHETATDWLRAAMPDFAKKSVISVAISKIRMYGDSAWEVWVRAQTEGTLP